MKKRLEYMEVNGLMMGLGCVYVVKSNGSDMYKIGCTKYCTPEKRVNSLNTANPFGVELICYMVIYNHRYWESWWHDFFKDKRVRGEWFRLDNENITDFITLSDGLKNSMTYLKEGFEL